DGTDAAVELYIVPSVDGTNYPDWTGNVTTDEQENAQYFVGAGTIRDEDGSATARAAVRGIEIPPGKYKVGVRNRANVAFAASGNTVKWRPWGYKSA
ncbi:MAG: hypothetical protein GWO08_01950, partial [Gammaproteobacteria bacterium]|nr:hypothetical protein [Gammaproteobacteria bacterium]NIW96977.1 hypothetical protein [Phycisphaerae bacterium]